MNEQSNDGTVTEADRIIAADIFEKMNSEWSCNDVAIQIRAYVAECVRRETEALRAERDSIRDKRNALYEELGQSHKNIAEMRSALATEADAAMDNLLTIENDRNALRAENERFQRLYDIANEKENTANAELLFARQELAAAKKDVTELCGALGRVHTILYAMPGHEAVLRDPWKDWTDALNICKEAIAKYADRRALS